MMDIYQYLKELNLTLPEVTTPGGNYESVNIRGNIAYIAIQFPIKDGKYLFQGVLGKTVTSEQGYEAMQLCALNILALIDKKIGFENVLGFNHLDAYYRSDENGDDAPIIVNGASDLLINVLKEKGNHSRSIFGVSQLPRGFSVGLTTSITLKT